MKKIILSIVFLIASFNTVGQVDVGLSSSGVSTSVEVSSIASGYLLSRMTQVQIDAIVSPKTEFMVYCADENVKGVYLFDGNKFLNVNYGLPFKAIADASSGLAIQQLLLLLEQYGWIET